MRWNEFARRMSHRLGQQRTDNIEYCIHEMAHVYDITGQLALKWVGSEETVHRLFEAAYKTYPEQDDAEARVSAITQRTLIMIRAYYAVPDVAINLHANTHSDVRPAFRRYLRDPAVDTAAREIADFCLRKREDMIKASEMELK